MSEGISLEIKQNTVRKKLRIGIVGCSARSTMFLSYFKRNANEGVIVGLCDIFPERAEILKKCYGLDAEIFTDDREMLEKLQLDAVAVCTADYAHVEPVIHALESDTNVFCEKPMAITLEDCDKMASAAQKTSAIFYLGFNLRHGPVHDTIHHLITTGHVGKVTTIEANEYYYGGKTYFRRWNRFRKFGGGLWLTKACHDFDLLNWMAGAKPKTVFATSSLSYYKPKPEAAKLCRECPLQLECPDYYDILTPKDDPVAEALRQIKIIGEQKGQEPGDLCLFNAEKDTFDNGIAVVTYENDIRTTYTVNVLTARSTREMRVIGTDGMIEADMERGIVELTERHTNKKYVSDLSEMMKSGHGGADDRLIKDFLYSCLTGKSPRSGWREGRLAVEVSLAARKSADTGQVVTLT